MYHGAVEGPVLELHDASKKDMILSDMFLQ
jgi:hypothetical protein